MKRLWSPWRMKYIEGHGARKGCIFCDALRLKDEEGLILRREERGFAILNRYPYTGGHLMIVPNDHIAAWDELPDETAVALHRLTRRALAALRTVYHAASFNLGVNMGEPAGAGEVGHVHLHIVPRWVGDANFMTTVGDVRVLPECLEDTWKKLHVALI